MAEENVFLFYPNLIGYARIVLAIIACFVMLDSPLLASFCYALSAFLDAFDGYLARLYNQSSRFGAMLDQLTDRLAFVGLLMALSALYPRWIFFFQLVVIIDIASHWLHLHAGDLTGKTSHKASDNPLLHYYYTSKPFLFFMCFGNEAFYGLLYLNSFWTGPNILLGITPMKILLAPFLVVALVKSGISVVHLITASQTVVEHDQALRAKAN